LADLGQGGARPDARFVAHDAGHEEVFATAVIAFLFTRLGLLRVKSATVAVLFATIVFLSGGVLGTLHHLYFTGTPTAVIALGASFSALEVVPLAFIGFWWVRVCSASSSIRRCRSTTCKA
jgi:nitric oxide reductase large subunit